MLNLCQISITSLTDPPTWIKEMLAHLIMPNISQHDCLLDHGNGGIMKRIRSYKVGPPADLLVRMY